MLQRNDVSNLSWPDTGFKFFLCTRLVHSAGSPQTKHGPRLSFGSESLTGMNCTFSSVDTCFPLCVTRLL
jgi:hypothetical protein